MWNLKALPFLHFFAPIPKNPTDTRGRKQPTYIATFDPSCAVQWGFEISCKLLNKDFIVVKFQNGQVWMYVHCVYVEVRMVWVGWWKLQTCAQKEDTYIEGKSCAGWWDMLWKKWSPAENFLTFLTNCGVLTSCFVPGIGTNWDGHISCLCPEII
jgi:hypothetical protein